LTDFCPPPIPHILSTPRDLLFAANFSLACKCCHKFPFARFFISFNGFFFCPSFLFFMFLYENSDLLHVFCMLCLPIVTPHPVGIFPRHPTPYLRSLIPAGSFSFVSNKAVCPLYPPSTDFTPLRFTLRPLSRFRFPRLLVSSRRIPLPPFTFLCKTHFLFARSLPFLPSYSRFFQRVLGLCPRWTLFRCQRSVFILSSHFVIGVFVCSRFVCFFPPPEDRRFCLCVLFFLWNGFVRLVCFCCFQSSPFHFTRIARFASVAFHSQVCFDFMAVSPRPFFPFVRDCFSSLVRSLPSAPCRSPPLKCHVYCPLSLRALSSILFFCSFSRLPCPLSRSDPPEADSPHVPF